MSQGELKVKHSHDQNHRMAPERWNVKGTWMKAARDKFYSLCRVYSVDRRVGAVHPPSLRVFNAYIYIYITW